MRTFLCAAIASSALVASAPTLADEAALQPEAPWESSASTDETSPGEADGLQPDGTWLEPIEEPAYEIPQRLRTAEPPAPAPERRRRFRKPGLVIAGAILTGLGGIALPVGGIVFAQADAERCDGFGCLGPALGKAIGATMMVTGAIQLAVGVPMLAVGAQPGREGDPAPALGDPPAPLLRVSAGPTGASFAIDF